MYKPVYVDEEHRKNLPEIVTYCNDKKVRVDQRQGIWHEKVVLSNDHGSIFKTL